MNISIPCQGAGVKKTVSDKKNMLNIKNFLKYMKPKIGGILFEVFSIANFYLECVQGSQTHQRTSEQGSNEVVRLACKFL
jgi:hypothetical protein